MASLPIESQVQAVVEAAREEVEQTTFIRHQHLEQLAAHGEPTAEECNFTLECDGFAAELAAISASTAPKLKRAGVEYVRARDEAELFLEEQGLPRRPPYRRSLIELAGWLSGAALVETIFTAGIYQPAVGWILALLYAAAISLGVTAPALFAGLGIVAARHRLSAFYRWSGIVLTACMAVLLSAVILGGAHFREVVAMNPRLAMRPRDLAREVWQSLMAAPIAPLAEMLNWALVGIAAVAALLVAWKTFHVFGYIGWRPLAIAEEEADDQFDRIRQAAEDEAAAGLRRSDKAIAAKTRAARRRRAALRRLIAVDRIVASARLRAHVIVQVEAANVQVLLQGANRGPTGTQQTLHAADLSKTPGRDLFDARLQGWISLHEQLIASRPAALTLLSERYVSFCAALQRATETATGAARSRQAAIGADAGEGADW